MKYATFRYDTIEVENGLNAKSKVSEYLMLCINITSIIIHEQGIKES